MMAEASWSLHPQLAADTASIGDLPLSRVVVMKDANYPWLILVPRRAGASEIMDLSAAEQGQLMSEIARTSAALKEMSACDKLNIAALGNVVPQLHVHIVARRKGDPAWPAPVWGKPRRDYDDAQLRQFIAAIGGKLGL